MEYNASFLVIILLLVFTVIGSKLDKIVQYSPRRDTKFLNQLQCMNGFYDFVKRRNVKTSRSPVFSLKTHHGVNVAGLEWHHTNYIISSGSLFFRIAHVYATKPML